jgi:selenoprotein W-related protein
LAAELLGEREWLAQVRSWKLIPTGGGLFEFVVNGTLLYSKKETGRHAEEGEIRGLFEKYLASQAVAAG